MRVILPTLLMAVLGGGLAVVASVQPTAAHDHVTAERGAAVQVADAHGDHGHDAMAVSVETARSRATAPTKRNGVAYKTQHNGTDAADRLVAGHTPVAQRVELHTHINDDGVMRMREVAAIEVPAGGKTLLEPGGLHIMLIGLNDALAAGQTFPLTLEFETAGTMTVDVTVGPPGATEPMSDGHHHHTH